MKIFATLLSLIFSVAAYTQDAAIIDKVVAKVGDEVILLSDVEEQYDYDRDRLGTIDVSAKCSILEGLMQQKLLINQARLDSVIVEDGQVESQLDGRIDQILAYMKNDISLFEEHYGKSIAQVRNEMKEDLHNQLTAQRMQQEVITNISITPSEVVEYFNEIPKDSLPFFSSEVEIGEIVIIPQVNDEERQKALDQITTLRERLLAGENFAELATTFSDDPGSGRDGGNLGLQKRGTFVPEFEAAAYNLTEGELSEIVESPFGFHLIELLERRGNLVDTRHILVKPNITQADLDKARAKADSVRQIFVNDTFTFERLVQEYSNEDEQSYTNSGRMVNPSTGNTFFQTSELDPDIFFAIDTLEIGEMTTPLEFTKQQGEKAYRIVLLQSRTDPHQANLKQDYTRIKEAAIERRKVEYLGEWFEEKMKTTFVEIDESFLNNCPDLIRWTGQTASQP